MVWEWFAKFAFCHILVVESEYLSAPRLCIAGVIIQKDLFDGSWRGLGVLCYIIHAGGGDVFCGVFICCNFFKVLLTTANFRTFCAT